MNSIKEFEPEIIKKLEEEIVKKFGYYGEDAKEYEQALKIELPEWINAHFDTLAIEYGKDWYKIVEGSFIKSAEFREAVIEKIIPLADAHTECFDKENGLKNIEKVLNYCPSSIAVLLPIVEKLDENDKKYILEKCLKFKDDISKKNKQADDKSNDENSSNPFAEALLSIFEKLDENDKKYILEKYPEFKEYIQKNNKQAGDKLNDENSSDPYTIVEKLNNDARELMKKLKESNDPTERRNIKEEIVEIQKSIYEIFDAEIKAIPEPTQQIPE